MTPREQIEQWLEVADIHTEKDCPHCAPMVGIVRAALGIIDRVHYGSIGLCRCGTRWIMGEHCPRKTEDEAALWKAIGGQE